MMSAVSNQLPSIAESFDVIVVGGGPAGSSAAIAAAKAGWTVLLVDRGSHPREKVCGCCLAPSGIDALASIGALDALDGAQRLERVRLKCASWSIVIPRAGSLAIGRDALDNALLRIASDRGCVVMTETVGVFESTNAVVLRHGGLTRTIQGRVRIAADGLQGSSLDRIDGANWRIAKSSRMGFGCVLEAGAIAVPREEILMCVHDGGYIGAVRLADGRIDIAAAAQPHAVRDAGGVANLALRWLGECVQSPEAIINASWKGTVLLTRRRRTLALGNVIIAGDAGGYVEPFTGEGMSWAITTGVAAGSHAAAMIAGRANATQWSSISKALVGTSRLRCLVTAHILRQPILLQGAMCAAHFFPRIAARVAESFGSQCGRSMQVQVAS